MIHLIGGVAQPGPDELFHANHGSVLRALEAAKQAGTKRFVLLSVPGADPETTQPFLRAKGLAEEAVRASGMEHAIVRSTHAYGLGGLWFTATVEGALAEPPFVVGPGDNDLAPISRRTSRRCSPRSTMTRPSSPGHGASKVRNVVTGDGLAGCSGETVRCRPTPPGKRPRKP